MDTCAQGIQGRGRAAAGPERAEAERRGARPGSAEQFCIHGQIGPLGAKQHRTRKAWHLSRRIGPENRNLNPVRPKYLVTDFYASPTNIIGLHLCDVASRRAGLADPGEGPATGVAVVLSSDSRCFYTESW